MTETWAESVRRRREELRISQGELADLADVSRGTIRNIEGDPDWNIEKGTKAAVERAVSTAVVQERRVYIPADAPADQPTQDATAATDRRWLWRLENNLAVWGKRETADRLYAYLRATCAHEWRHYEEAGGYPAHSQCLWCHAIAEEATHD